MKRGLINSLSLGIFGAIGLGLLFFCHGLWYEAANQAGLRDFVHFSIEPTKLRSLEMSIPFSLIVFVLLVGNTFLSMKFKMVKYAWVIFPTFSFASILIVGIGGSYVIPLANNWYVWLTITIFGGICGFSHNVYLSSFRLHRSITSMTSKHTDKSSFVKSLELKHTSLLATLQWVVWGCIIFITAGIVTVLYNPLELAPRTVHNVYVLNTLILTTWCLFGIIFGVVAPMFGQMQHLRETMLKVVAD